MKNIVFERELKTLINGVRSYGIEHCLEREKAALFQDSEEQKNFVIQVHKGFFMVQNNAIFMLKKILKEQKALKSDLKQARREHNKKRAQEIDASLRTVKYQEMVVRKSVDSIAWQLFGYDITIMRRVYYGQELIDITDSNLESEQFYIERYIEENPEAFVLISDLTSFIQVGDVVTFTPREGLKIGELKEGKVNAEVFQMINDIMQNDCPNYLKCRMGELDTKTKEQFYRDIKQMDRSFKTMSTINEGKGTDLFTRLPVVIDKNEIRVGTFTDVVKELLGECTKKGHAISVIDGCLLIGVYETKRFPSGAFDVWARSLDIKMPVVDLRHGMFDPLGYPIFLHPFKNDDILAIIQGRKVVKMTIDINAWLNTFANDGIKWRWLSEKETARINTKMKGKTGIFSLEKRGIELENEKGIKQYIGEGIFSRIFTGLNRPHSMKDFLVTTMDRAVEKSDTLGAGAGRN